jgi:hypothetical protein
MDADKMDFEKTLISYEDDNGLLRFKHISTINLKYYDAWMKFVGMTKDPKFAAGTAEQRKKVYDLIESHKKKAMYENSKDVTIKCECGCMVIKCVMARHKKTDKHTNYMATLERGEIPSSDSKEITCECGAIVARSHISEHRKTQKHNKAMELKK